CVLVGAASTPRRELVQLVDPAAAEHDVVRLYRRGQPLDDREHRLPPLLRADAPAGPLADVVLERLLPEREVPELERLHDAVHDQGGPEPGAEAQEEHATPGVTPDRLHRGVVRELDGLPERALVVEGDPAVAEVDWLGDHLAAAHGRRDADGGDVPGPALDEPQHAR